MSGQPHMQSFVDEPRSDSEAPSMRRRVGFIIGSGAVAAVVASLPVAFRTLGDATFGLVLERWLVLSGITTPLAVMAIAVWERARVGLRMLVGERRAPFILGMSWWCVIELALLSLFGAVLKKTTHHHALAGVTFAMFAVVSGIVVALFAARTTAILVRAGARSETLGLRIAAVCVGLGIFIVGLRASRADGLHTTAAISDGFVFVVATIFGSLRIRERFARLPTIGIPLAAVLIVVGLAVLRFDAPLQKELEETAPIFGIFTGLLGD